MPFTIRKLEKEDAAAFKAVRLEGLINHPEAFRQSAREFELSSVEDIARLIPQPDDSRAGFILGGFLGIDDLVGVVALQASAQDKRTHIGVLWGMYVRPEARRQGLGARLVRALLELALNETDLQVIQLTAATANLPAIRLYESLGFRSYGREPRALKVGDIYYDQEHMILELRPSH
ncbi:MAG: GNAT family N-acetyltransferase [Candidatus Zixiibacteriota bacterium]